MSSAAVLEVSSARAGAASRKLSRHITPTDKEVFFGKDEIIVSKTDLKGHLTYVNRTFLTISGYVEEELLGQPHSLIRHPSMPRCVFRLLWTYLQSGKEIFAYVKNMTKSGDYYWVLAHATPSITLSGETVGYHSSRRLPERRAIDTIVPLYRALKATEDTEPDRRAGLDKSEKQLRDLLQEKNTSYDEFILSI